MGKRTGFWAFVAKGKILKDFQIIIDFYAKTLIKPFETNDRKKQNKIRGYRGVAVIFLNFAYQL